MPEIVWITADSVSGYYMVCRFNGAPLTRVFPDGKTADGGEHCLKDITEIPSASRLSTLLAEYG